LPCAEVVAAQVNAFNGPGWRDLANPNLHLHYETKGHMLCNKSHSLWRSESFFPYAPRHKSNVGASNLEIFGVEGAGPLRLSRSTMASTQPHPRRQSPGVGSTPTYLDLPRACSLRWPVCGWCKPSEISGSQRCVGSVGIEESGSAAVRQFMTLLKQDEAVRTSRVLADHQPCGPPRCMPSCNQKYGLRHPEKEGHDPHS
jgi:hypothetical protein